MPDKKRHEISAEEFNHLVQLAALQLDEEQGKYLLHELNKQLQAVRELETIPLAEDLPLAIHGVPFEKELKQELRKDVCEPFNDPEDIIAQAPQTEEGYLNVPDIPHTTLE